MMKNLKSVSTMDIKNIKQGCLYVCSEPDGSDLERWPLEPFTNFIDIKLNDIIMVLEITNFNECIRKSGGAKHLMRLTYYNDNECICAIVLYKDKIGILYQDDMKYFKEI